jgi:penicillin amidase
MRRTTKRRLALVTAAIALVMVGGFTYLRQSLPRVGGTVVVTGISAPIEIVRDADAVPHIFAAAKLDALYGLGYVHAQDRLWQMEFQRRIGRGRLSELFGAATLPEDRFLRTVGFARAADAAWDRLDVEARRAIDAYVAGINQFLSDHHGRALPPEFTLLRFEPDRWTGSDVLVWAKMMAWDLSQNYALELVRHDLAARVGMERMAQLLPPSPADGLSILGAEGNQKKSGAPVARNRVNGEYNTLSGSWFAALVHSLPTGHRALRDLLLGGASTESLGSNSWVVDGTLTASGKPLLANDPHLAAHVPSLWYLAHMSAGDLDVIGATLPGTPAIAIGRNRFIAWGETNLGADVEDLYEERLDPSGRTAEYRGRQEPLGIRTETIAVKGARDVRLTVRTSRHGPLVSDAINANNAEALTALRRGPLGPLALRWTGLDDDDRSVAAFLKLNEAHDWADFTDTLRDLSVPSQNFVYADTTGHIGYYAAGRIPIRARGDGSFPSEGWTGEAEWTGWIPFDELPHTFDPPGHAIVTANNRPAPSSYPYLMTVDFPEAYRARRIGDLLRQRDNLRPGDFRAMQADTLSLHAQTLLPLLLGRAHPEQSLDRQAVHLVSAWNFDARGDSAAAAIFEAWFLQLAPALVGDELGPLGLESYRGRYSHVTRFLIDLLRSADSRWCDDVRTPKVETCDEAVTEALHVAVAGLARQLGGDMLRWRWDIVHRAIFPHQGLDGIGLLRPLLSRSVRNGGDWSTVDVGAIDAEHPLEQRAIPGYRQIVDLSPENDSSFLDAVGQSGHFLSAHYDDFLGDWRDVRLRRMRTDRREIDRGALGHLRLVPRSSSNAGFR